MDYNLEKLSHRIKYIRKIVLNNMGQVNFAKTLGVSQQAVSQWEKAETAEPRHMNKIAIKHGINYRWLMEGEGEVMLDTRPHMPEWLAPIAEDLSLLKDTNPKAFQLIIDMLAIHAKKETTEQGTP